MEEKDFIKVLKYCIDKEQVSVSLIQRRFPIGYINSCKIFDWMESMEYIAVDEETKKYKLLITKDEFISIYGNDYDS